MITKKVLPQGDFYAVIFSSTKNDTLDGYAEMDELTMKLAQEQDGFLSYESVTKDNTTIFISYWKDKAAIDAWRKNAVHQVAKSQATTWYKRYLSQICLVESSYLFEKNE